MNTFAKVTLALIFSAALIYITNGPSETNSLTSTEKYANFNDTELKKIRSIIHRAGTNFSASYDMVAAYIQGQMNNSYTTYWNVAVYHAKDFNSNFYLTGMYDETHSNKRYYQVTDAENFTFSVLILETNNTDPTSQQYNTLPVVSGKSLNLEEFPQTINIEGLTYTKKKSPYVTSAQQAGIDLAMSTAYTWNKNIVDFTKVAQKLTEANLNQHWQVCTRYENIHEMAFVYTSVYQQWVQYIGYGLGSYVLHVYLYRNCINC